MYVTLLQVKLLLLEGREKVRDINDVHGLLTTGPFTKSDLVRLLKIMQNSPKDNPYNG